MLVSSTVKDLVAGAGITTFQDRRPHELKGIPGEWHLYAVAADAESGPCPLVALPPDRDTDRSTLARPTLAASVPIAPLQSQICLFP